MRELNHRIDVSQAAFAQHLAIRYTEGLVEPGCDAQRASRRLARPSLTLVNQLYCQPDDKCP